MVSPTVNSLSICQWQHFSFVYHMITDSFVQIFNKEPLKSKLLSLNTVEYNSFMGLGINLRGHN